MANGGGSRIGGFVRGVLMGLVVCAIGVVALSLSAPVPERAAPGDALPSGALDGAGPAATAEPAADVEETDTAPAVEVITETVPVTEPATPQATPQPEPAPEDAETPATDSDAFTAPQAPSE